MRCHIPGHKRYLSTITVDPKTGRLDFSSVPGLDQLHFPRPVELCRCCGIEALASGDKWDTWFCAECHDRVLALNRELGAWVFPIGRHTVMHGVVLSGGDTADEANRDAFVAAANGLFARMGKLGDWAEEIVRRNCVAAGLGTLGPIKIRRYLRAVRLFSREMAFEAMCDWWIRAGDRE